MENVAEQMFGSSDGIVDNASGVIRDQSDMDSRRCNCDRDEKIEATGYNREKPPKDDCCPICFGDFRVPCKANCGHWFCGGCILQLWEYRSRPGQCKCPFCNSGISKLTPQVSPLNKTDGEDGEIVQNIELYNRFYGKGIEGFLMISTFYLQKHGPLFHVYMWSLLRALVMAVINAPGSIKRVFADMIMHPERIRINYERIRVLACTMTVLLYLYQGLLAPDQRLQMRKMKAWIDFASIVLVILPYTIILCKTWIHAQWLRFRMWQMRREPDALRKQAVALRAQVDALRVREATLLEEIARLRQERDQGA